MRYHLYRPSKSTMQSGRGKTQEWVLEPDLLSPRVPEPLMGWSSCQDTLTEMRGRLRFATKEDALAFVRRQGFECWVDDPMERIVVARSYQDNFRIKRPEDEERAVQKKA